MKRLIAICTVVGLIFAVGAPVGHAALPSVLIVAADYSPPTAELIATGRFSTVDYFDARYGTPSLATLAPYDAVLAYTNWIPYESRALGDILADYVDSGGRLNVSTYGLSSPWAINGRIMTSGYCPLTNLGTNGNVSGNLVVITSDSIFDGIDLPSVSYFHNSNFAHPGIDSGATLLATDGSGINMIAVNNSRSVIALNLFPSTYSGNNAEFYELLANSLTLGPPCPLMVDPLQGFNPSGYERGPFDPSSKIYALTNSGPNSLIWDVNTTCSWLDLYPSGGNLPVGANTTVTVSVNALANSLEPGIYSGEIIFRDLTSDCNVVRNATLEVYHVYHVDADAIGANNGSSWEDAFNYLQDALDLASSGDQIWVAEGIYKPDEDTDHPDGTGEREATFQLKNGVAIYGGYAGFGEPDPNERDVELYETALSADLNGDDGPDFANNDENSYHVVTGSGTDQTAVLEGFTITAGNANGSWWPADMGGGMYNYMGSPTVTDCMFSENSASYEGGGIANYESNPTLTGCTLSWNTAYYGGGMINSDNSSPTLTNCTFRENSTEAVGGGMLNWNHSSPVLTDCMFSENSASGGGGMINWESSSPTVTNCDFSGNSADWDGGGMNNRNNSSPTVTNCTFSGNSARYAGGGMYNYDLSYSGPTVTNCTFTGNSAGWGGGMYNENFSYPTITNCTFSGNSAGQRGGGMCNFAASSPTLTNCILWSNRARYFGSQIYNYSGCVPTVSYSDVQGGWPGAGNIAADPCFVAPDSNDFHLLPSSPCIDAGDNTAVPADTTDLDGDGNTTEPIPFDLDGNPRFVDGDNDGNSVVDMGAYELLTLPALIEGAIAEKLEALEKIDAALEKELEAYEILEQLLESRDYGDWTRQAILGARWKISIAIFYEEDYIKKVLEKNIDKLQRTLSVLGVETNEGNDGDIPVPSAGAYEAAVLSLHELVINLIEEAIAEKAEAMERINAALQKERQAYELLEQMLINRDYGDWNRQDILRAKSRIYVAIKYEEYLKKVLMIKTVDELEDSLSRLGVEAYDGSD